MTDERESANTPVGGRQVPLAASLGWMAEHLAEERLRPPAISEDDEEGDPRWGPSASIFPSEYWHWQYLWSLVTPDSDASLPTSGPVLSIVVPVFRPTLWYFEECVLSVINQSYGNWELCLCDDGSGDEELTELMLHFAATDSRIKAVVLQENGGISRATNRALAEATGEFIVLLDHDDLLEHDALAEIAAVIATVGDADVIYTDEDKLDELGRSYEPHFKPDWDPELLLSYPYLGHITAVRHEVMRSIGGFRPEVDGSQDYDVMLRATEIARSVVHIPKVLYHWRVVSGSAAGDPDAKPWAYAASRRALEDAISRRGLEAVVETGPFLGGYHVRRAIAGSPTVSVIIPFRDQAALTMACISSLEEAPGYPITEIVLVDNGSSEPETKVLRRQLSERTNIRLLDFAGAFNWAAINNLAAATCETDLLLFMNNDIEASSPGWLHALVELSQRKEVGAVGARLVYPDGVVQHAGVILGTQGIVSHIFQGLPKGHRGYAGWDEVIRSYSAVTAACMMTRRDVFEELDGFDEAYPVAFNDIDFCLRLGRAGYRVLYTPHAELTHYESISRGLSGYSKDFQVFLSRWWEVVQEEDPFYSRNLTRFNSWCSFRAPGEDERWKSLITPMVPLPAAPDASE